MISMFPHCELHTHTLYFAPETMIKNTFHVGPGGEYRQERCGLIVANSFTAAISSALLHNDSAHTVHDAVQDVVCHTSRCILSSLHI